MKQPGARWWPRLVLLGLAWLLCLPLFAQSLFAQSQFAQPQFAQSQFAQPQSAKPLSVQAPSAQAPAPSDLAVLVDAAGTETIDSVSAPAANSRFLPVGLVGFNGGFTRDVHWLRFTLQVPTPGPWWLEMQPAVLDDLRLFEPVTGGHVPGGHVERRTGDRLPFANRELDFAGFVFKLELPDLKPRTFYLRVQTTSSAHAKLKLWRPDDFNHSRSHRSVGFGVYFGLAAMLCFLNFVLFCVLRKPLFGWFSLLVLSQGLLFFGYAGLASQFLPSDAPLMADFWTLVSLAAYLSLAAPFCRSLMPSGFDSRLSRLMYRVQLGLPWLLVPAWFVGYNGAAACLAFACTFSFWLWLSGVALLRRDATRGLRRILVVHAVVQAGNFSQVLVLLGWQLDGGLSNMLWMVPNFAALLILQFALSLRLGSLRDERALAQWQSVQFDLEATSARATLAEQARSHRQLTKALADLLQAHRLSKIGSWEVNLKSGQSTGSDVLLQMMGLALDGPRDMNFEERRKLFMPESWDRWREALAQVKAFGKPVVLELELVPFPGRVRWIEVRAALSLDEHGQPAALIGTAQDIDERRSLQAAAAASAQQAAANRNRSELLARVSHELRTPLNAVLGFSQLLSLEEQVRASPALAEPVDLILGAADHLKSMIDDVLDLAMIQADGLRLVAEPSSVGPLAAECLSWLTPMAASRQLTLSLVGQALGWRVIADHRRLRQVLINLLSNAIKYNRAGGHVSLAISHEPGLATDESNRGAGWVCLAVSDTGQGLTQRQIDALYQPFNRLGAELGEVEGTGLGLALARELTEAMGGSLQVRSELGQGSVFTLRLPAAQGLCDTISGATASEPSSAIEVFKAAPEQTEWVDTNGPLYVVLYVEDNRLNVLVMRHALKRLEGVRLEVAVDGGTGLSLARQLHPDLLLIDLNLPVLNGTELMRRLRADPAFSRTPCVAVSANSLPNDIELALAAGFDDYVTKPFAVDRVLDLVQRLRRQSRLQCRAAQAELFDSVQ